MSKYKGYAGYSEAQARASKAYDEKTYQKINIALRYDEDADIIAAWRAAQDQGIKNREWLRELFDNQK